jgi:hypothetical protein
LSAFALTEFSLAAAVATAAARRRSGLVLPARAMV